MGSGERPIGAAKGKQSDTEALCQTPPSHCVVRTSQPGVFGMTAYRGTDQAVRGGRHGQKVHSGCPPGRGDARGSANACLSSTARGQ